jgi:hypothetical protein
MPDDPPTFVPARSRPSLRALSGEQEYVPVEDPLETNSQCPRCGRAVRLLSAASPAPVCEGSGCRWTPAATRPPVAKSPGDVPEVAMIATVPVRLRPPIQLPPDRCADCIEVTALGDSERSRGGASTRRATVYRWLRARTSIEQTRIGRVYEVCSISRAQRRGRVKRLTRLLRLSLTNFRERRCAARGAGIRRCASY